MKKMLAAALIALLSNATADAQSWTKGGGNGVNFLWLLGGGVVEGVFVKSPDGSWKEEVPLYDCDSGRLSDSCSSLFGDGFVQGRVATLPVAGFSSSVALDECTLGVVSDSASVQGHYTVEWDYIPAEGMGIVEGTIRARAVGIARVLQPSGYAAALGSIDVESIGADPVRLELTKSIATSKKGSLGEIDLDSGSLGFKGGLQVGIGDVPGRESLSDSKLVNAKSRLYSLGIDVEVSAAIEADGKWLGQGLAVCNSALGCVVDVDLTAGEDECLPE